MFGKCSARAVSATRPSLAACMNTMQPQRLVNRSNVSGSTRTHKTPTTNSICITNTTVAPLDLATDSVAAVSATLADAAVLVVCTGTTAFPTKAWDRRRDSASVTLPGLRALTLPAIALALPQASILARVMRSAVRSPSAPCARASFYSGAAPRRFAMAVSSSSESSASPPPLYRAQMKAHPRRVGFLRGRDGSAACRRCR